MYATFLRRSLSTVGSKSVNKNKMMGEETIEERRNWRREIAHKYCDTGYSIIPVGSDKKPLIKWEKYQKERATHEQIEEWFKQFPDMNIAVVTGAISGIIVADIEAGGSIEGFPQTATAQTGGRGFHFYYKHPGYEVKNATRITELTDIRGDGGYVVAPPSISEKGDYAWLIAPWDYIEKPEYAEGKEMADYPAEFINSLRKPSKVRNDILTPASIPVGQRNSEATRFIGTVLSALPVGLWDLAGWGGLKEWNLKQTEKPLDERELRSVFESIRSREATTRGTETDNRALLEPFTLAQLFVEEFPPVLWLAQDLIPLGGVTAITGDSNTFKSFITIALAVSEAQGQPFLGHFATNKGKVLIVDEENHRRFIRKRFEEIGMAATEDIIFLSQTGIKLDNENYTKALKEVLDKERPTLVILDSLVRFHSREENSATEMAKVMNEIKKLVADDRAIVVVHHHKKEQGGFQRKSGAQSVRGSSDIFASLDCHISVERKEDHLVLTQNKLRIQPQLDPFKVSVIKADNYAISFIYDGTDTTRQDKILEVVEEIKALLAVSVEALPAKAIRDEITTASKNVFVDALKVALASGDVVSSRRAHGAYYYELAKTEADQGDEEPEIVDAEIVEEPEMPF